MIDESMDKEQMQLPPKPDEFRTKPAWQRFLVMIAGVVMNVLLAIFIYIGFCYTRAASSDSKTATGSFRSTARRWTT